MAESDNESGGGGSNASSMSAAAREQDRFLPIANVSRIMKKALPANAKISKEAKETVQECVSEFISFITGEASDKCQREKRKTVNGDDLLWAMTTLGFEDYVDPLKLYLQKFREIEGEKSGAPPGGGNGGGGGVPSPDSQPPQKEGGGGMMTTMMGQHMYGSSLYHHLNHLNHHHQSQYQYQYQHQNQNQNHHHQIGMGDGSASASSSAGIGSRGDRI